MCADSMRVACEDWIREWNRIDFNLMAKAMERDGFANWKITQRVENDDGEFEYRYDGFPAVRAAWQPHDPFDEEFISKHQQEIMDIGFVIIHHPEFGYWLAVDGYGYSFLDAHWLPLYRLRGMQCHESYAIYDQSGYALFEDEHGILHAVRHTDERTREYYDRHHADGHSTGSEQ